MKNRLDHYRKKSVIFLIGGTLFLTSCASFFHKDNRTLGEIKNDLACVEYKENLTWQELESAFGKADEYPIAESQKDIKEGKYSRVYYNKDIIVYTERQKINDAYQGIITKIEVCRKK